MEIDITHLADDPDLWCYSGSAAEHGPNAAQFTWSQAKEQGEATPLLTTPEQLEAAREHFADYGAWESEEIAAWTPEDLNGLAVQEAASALRERDMFETLEEWEAACYEGTCSGQVYRDDSGERWYLYLGC